MSDFRNVISLRAFSRMTLGSWEVQRRQLGANTIAKLAESILVWLTTSGAVNCCKNPIRYVSTCKRKYLPIVINSRLSLNHKFNTYYNTTIQYSRSWSKLVKYKNVEENNSLRVTSLRLDRLPIIIGFWPKSKDWKSRSPNWLSSSRSCTTGVLRTWSSISSLP